MQLVNYINYKEQFKTLMKKTFIISAMILVFAAAIYFFEQGDKDPSITPNEAPSHVKG